MRPVHPYRDGQFRFAIADSHGSIMQLKEYQLSLKLHSLQELTDAFQSIFNRESILSSGFRKVSYAISNKSFVFVPSKFFVRKEAANYLAHAMNLNSEQEIGVSEVEDLHSQMVFALPEILHQQIRTFQPNSNLVHSSIGLFNAYQKNKAVNSSNYFGLHFRGPIQFVSLIQDGFLRFHNAFKIESAKDALYYLLLAAEQMHMSPAESDVLLSGEIRMDSEVVKLVKRYFQSVGNFSGNIPDDLKEKFHSTIMSMSLGLLLYKNRI
ncbi:MAG: DUF3822 family protein [Saprospiraceae bacterium]